MSAASLRVASLATPPADRARVALSFRSLVTQDRNALILMGMECMPMLQIMGMVWCRSESHEMLAGCIGGALNVNEVQALFGGCYARNVRRNHIAWMTGSVSC